MKPSNIKKIENLLEKNKATEKKLETFEETLRGMTGVEAQKILLWLEIYDNASSDRAIASALFTQGFTMLGQTSGEHISIGPLLVKYLERMTKSNDQLLALSQIIAKEVEKEATMASDDIFEKIEG